MFIQVITAKVGDAEGLLRQLDRWEAELRPGAEGFLGSTGGATEDGRLIALIRFESEEAAQANSDRPEQSAWWAETEKLLTDVDFKNSVEVMTMRGGGSDDAGFVQVMRGHITDKDKMEALRARMGEFEASMAQHRPDVLGDVTAIHADGTFTDAVYFSSEAEARANEAKPPPAEVEALFEEFMSAFSVDEYFDLKEPRMT
jgi:hypothetical protein